jgi:hypothetical protein
MTESLIGGAALDACHRRCRIRSCQGCHQMRAASKVLEQYPIERVAEREAA